MGRSAADAAANFAEYRENKITPSTVCVFFDNLGKGERNANVRWKAPGVRSVKRVRGGAGLRGEAAEKDNQRNYLRGLLQVRERWKIWSSEKGFMVDA
jgi:hypothetical protein